MAATVGGMDAEIETLMRRAPMPAVGVAVFTVDSVLFSRVHGTADLTTAREAYEDDWWDLASLTKVLVTLPEVLERMDLEAPLQALWPRAAGLPIGTATVAQLLAHNAGLPATLPFFRTASNRAEIVTQALSTPLERPIGSDAVYSDIGFLLLGEAVADISGAGLAQLAERRTGLRYAPLPGQAVATELCPWRERMIVGEAHDENAWAMDGVAGQAGAFGTLRMVMTAARSWLAGSAVPRPLHLAATSCHATNADGERFGLGWWLAPTRGIGGTDPGPGSFGASGFVGNRIWFEPARGYGLLVLSNRIHPHRGDRAPFGAWCAALLGIVAATFA